MFALHVIFGDNSTHPIWICIEGFGSTSRTAVQLNVRMHGHIWQMLFLSRIGKLVFLDDGLQNVLCTAQQMILDFWVWYWYWYWYWYWSKQILHISKQSWCVRFFFFFFKAYFARYIVSETFYWVRSLCVLSGWQTMYCNGDTVSYWHTPRAIYLQWVNIVWCISLVNLSCFCSCSVLLPFSFSATWTAPRG